MSAVRQQSSGPQSATILTSVAGALSDYAASHPVVFAARAHADDAAGKMRSRVPEHARTLLAHATALCTPRASPRTISAWRGVETVARVLSKTELGEYSRLWENDTGGGGASALGHGTGGTGVRGSDVPAPPLPVGAFFGSWYRESSLVLRTSVAMGMVMKYAAAEAAHRHTIDFPGGDFSDFASDTLWELLIEPSSVTARVASRGDAVGSDSLSRLVDYVCDNGSLSLGVSLLASSIGADSDALLLSLHDRLKAVAHKVRAQWVGDIVVVCAVVTPRCADIAV